MFKETPLHESKHKILKTKTLQNLAPQHQHLPKKTEKKYWLEWFWRKINRENHDWKEVCIAFPINQNLRKVKEKTGRIMKLFKNYPNGHHTVLNELIHSGAKLVSNKIDILQRNSNGNSKPGWEMKLEGINKETITKRRETSQEHREMKKPPSKETITGKSENKAGKINWNILAEKETQKILERVKITKENFTKILRRNRWEIQKNKPTI